jgi:hypothetical protein
VLVLVWAAVLAAALLAGRVLPVTEASGEISKPWGLGVGALLLLAVYVLANRLKPDFDVAIPMRRPAAAAPVRRRAAS